MLCGGVQVGGVRFVFLTPRVLHGLNEFIPSGVVCEYAGDACQWMRLA